MSFYLFAGSYTVNLPDGRTQIVTYKADHYGGFVADVKYEGRFHHSDSICKLQFFVYNRLVAT